MQHHAIDGSALLGFLTLALALVCRAATGALQEISCRTYGASIAEQMFFRNALGIPILLSQWSTIFDHASKWTFQQQVGGLPGSALWLLLAMNISFDYGTKVFITRLI